MMWRILFAGALVGLPFLVSSAVAETPAIPAASSTPSAAPAGAASPPAPTNGATSAASPAPAPATPDSLVSPFLPAPDVATPRRRRSARRFDARAPRRQRPRPLEQSRSGANRRACSSGDPRAPKPKKVAPPSPPRETALSDDPAPTLQPDTFFATAKASERYAAIVDAGGWPTDIVALGPGTKGPAVANLRKRLAIEGDLDAKQASGLAWDTGLTAAVKRFQSRMGLRQTGVVAGATLKAINVPASVRFNQLASSANRLAGLNFSFDQRYVVVNLPSTSVEAVENGRVAHRYVAIVGDPEHPSPEISAHIQVINLNPTWTVPTSIIKKEIIPRMQRDPGYLTRAKIRILDGSGQEINPRHRQLEHGTGGQLHAEAGFRVGQFARLRSASACPTNSPSTCTTRPPRVCSAPITGSSATAASGCRGSMISPQWLLQGTGGGPEGVWDKAALQAKIKEGAPYDIKLAKAVPVIWVYLTGWSNGDGPANFRDDVYGIDTVGEAQASAQASPAR